MIQVESGIVMLFRYKDLEVRHLFKEDRYLLAKWLSDPMVLEYYEGRDNPFDVVRVESKFFVEDGITRCIICYRGVPIGYIQFYQLDDDSRNLYGYTCEEVVYGLDQFIGEVEYWNKGIGTLLITSMVEYLYKEENADRIVMDPQVGNERALKCYEKCGFKKVKVLPKNELHEGEYRDCWLIEHKRQI
ncbi:GNAT family N-acetyltransferase [Bacillaceae bacterium W0354]